MDDWGAFTSVGKKKKGKKGADPDPIPPPPPEPVDLGASATADANPDDEWLGFSTGKKKKGAKKGKVRALFCILAVSARFGRRSHATPKTLRMCWSNRYHSRSDVTKCPVSRFHIPITVSANRVTTRTPQR